jgi:hypothetical protein
MSDFTPQLKRYLKEAGCCFATGEVVAELSQGATVRDVEVMEDVSCK